jgi:Domain of unknown function (DUF1905)/Bacteriocin-protection, YdeI or OmpD-Associated
MTRHSFQAKLIRPEGIGTWTYIDLPFDAVTAFGKKGQVRVQGTIDGQAYRSTAMPHGDGRHYLVVNRTIRDAAGADVGSTVHVVMEVDSAKRTVTVPADFTRALAANPAAKKEFKGFPYPHQKEMVEWIRDAKRAETRKRRIALAIERLAAGTA